MDIQKKPTLAEKQTFWAEQLPNFESKYWLPSHFEFLAFDMDHGNYIIKDDLDPRLEDDANEIFHRVNTGWAMWKKAVNFTVNEAKDIKACESVGARWQYSSLTKQVNCVPNRKYGYEN